mgnify:CR=1 FL=1
MKKIAVGGKGGSGKSSTVTLLAGALRDRGYRVLVVDSDESNPALFRMLGLDERPAPLLDLVGGKSRVFQAFSEGEYGTGSLMTRETIHLDDIPSDYVATSDGISMVCIGKILESLEGCACPMGVLAREFLKRLSLAEDEVALIDLEAGIEHFGRGVETSVDSMLIVTEPSLDSLELAEKMNTLAEEVGMANVWTILNKVPSEELGARLREELEDRGASVIGTLAHDPEILRSGLHGNPITSTRARQAMDQIVEKLV